MRKLFDKLSYEEFMILFLNFVPICDIGKHNKISLEGG